LVGILPRPPANDFLNGLLRAGGARRFEKLLKEGEGWFVHMSFQAGRQVFEPAGSIVRISIFNSQYPPQPQFTIFRTGRPSSARRQVSAPFVRMSSKPSSE